jgi:hypothetical protein
MVNDGSSPLFLNNPFIGKIDSVETGMNGSSHPKHENCIYDVPRLRASPRHGGAIRFIQFDLFKV